MKISIAANQAEIVSFVEFSLDLRIDQLTSPVLGSFRNKLANLLEIPTDDIHILGLRPGSDVLMAFTRFAVTIPDDIRERLIYYQVRTFKPWMELPSVLTFVSHSPGDSEKANEIYEYLQHEKFNPWLDRESILPGEKRLTALLRNIKDPTAFLYCLSRNSIYPGRTLLSEIREAERKAEVPAEDAIFTFIVRLDECVVPPHFIKYPLVDWEAGRNKHKLSGILAALQMT